MRRDRVHPMRADEVLESRLPESGVRLVRHAMRQVFRIREPVAIQYGDGFRSWLFSLAGF